MEEETARTPGAIVEPLPRQQRQRLFLTLFLIFVIAVPVFVFYATGYRYSIFDTENGVTATGGLYIGVAQNAGDIYVDDEPARGSRIFRRATYIQSVIPGVHQIHVQGEGVHTWVKNLPVFPYMVTEAEAFLMPLTPEARLITASSTDDGLVVTVEQSELLDELGLLLDITSDFVEMTPTTTATTTPVSAVENPEHLLLEALFNPVLEEETATTTPVVIPPGTFRFAGEFDATTTATSAPEVVTRNDLELFTHNQELFVRYQGSARSIPHYFCVPTAALASTTELYGAHVAYGIDQARVIQTTVQPTVSETLPGDTRICRNEIRIDTKEQQVISFDFYPDNRDYVIVHQADGIFVVEIDDRSWQNVQPLLPIPVDAMKVDNGRIYVQIADFFLEIRPDLSNL